MAKQNTSDDLNSARKELAIQNAEKEKRAAELIVANKELLYQNTEKEKRAAELIVANKELLFQNTEKEKRAAELIVANKELLFQNIEKEKRAAELFIANAELLFQNQEKKNRADELGIANKELLFQNQEKQNRADELGIANKELLFQNQEKQNRADELGIANKELLFQNQEKQNRADELGIANKELLFQNQEKQNRADELGIANKELLVQSKEKARREATSKAFEVSSHSHRLDSLYSRSLIESSRDPLFTISPEGKITDVNQATVKVTGVSRELLIGSEFYKYFTAPEKARKGYKQVFAKGFVVDYPLTIMDGKLTDVLFNGSLYKDHNGLVLGAVVVARDITEQNRIEKELREAKTAAEYATSVAEEAKANAEIAALTAENAVRAKQQFLSNMSHEIRTPMNAIIGFTKVVLKTGLTDKQKEYLDAIKVSGDALIVLINDILDLAKVDAGKMTFEKIPFKLKASMDSMLHLFEPKIEEKNLKLKKVYDECIPEVLLGDPVRLHQIILNLVSNALKFTPKGSISVHTRLLNEDDNQATIEFVIKDTGIGIDSEKMKSIFGNFQQATSGTSRLYGGTGLGLSIVKQLIEPQGGFISVESELGKGSAFRFVLSFGKTTESIDVEPEIVEINKATQHIRVLVVEDIALNQLLMKTLLDDFGFEREIAENGRIAIEKLKTGHYDIVLMDLQMPEMNGFEATEYIRKTLKMDIPILALTADVTTVDLAKCTAVGMNDYIAKPVDDRLLYNKILSLVRKSEGSKAGIERKANGRRNTQMRYTDLKYLSERTKSDSGLMMEMITLYLDQTPILISSIKSSLIAEDWETMQSAVHKMIPSFAIMGISPDFENVARRLQDYASARREADKIPHLVSQLEEVCTNACIELQDAFKTMKKTQK